MSDLAERFLDALDDYGPVPIWWWSGAPLERTRLRWQMGRLMDGGVRQAVVLNLAPNGPLYGCLADEPELFGEHWWDVFLDVCGDAKELGFRLWFYDQLGFSGADFQGRLLARAPHHRGEALERLAMDVAQPHVLRPPEGARPLAGFVTEPGRRTRHVPLEEGCLHWLGPGPARLELVHARPHGFDYLSPDACADLIDGVHGEFARRLGDLLGTVVVGSFQDELPSMPTWSPRFAGEFAARRGYPLEPHLLDLWEQRSEGTGAVRADYQRTRAELAEEAFFRPLHTWHQDRGLLVGCDQQHPARAGYPLEATQQYADYLRTHRWFSAPGSDHWGDATLHSSLAHLYDRPRTWVEAFHSTGWGGTLEETLDWLLPWLRAGANLFDPHAVYYAQPAGSWEWAPPSTCWRQPYWRHYSVFSQLVARTCAALTWGHHACDVAVLFPTTTVQTEVELESSEHLLGAPQGTSAAQDTYLELVGRMQWYDPQPGVLERAGWDLDVLDDESLVRAEVVDGRLHIGHEAYSAVVLPACPVLEAATREALVSFLAAGGTVVVVGAGPDLPGALRCGSAADVPAALATLPRRVECPLPTLLRTHGAQGVLLVTAGAATVQPEHQRWREEGYAFDRSRYAARTTVSVTNLAGPVAMWDPVTATARRLPARREGERLHVDVAFGQNPFALLVFGEHALDLPQVTAAPLSGEVEALLPDWSGEVLAAPDDPWAWEAGGASSSVQIWHLEQRRGETWTPVKATFGPRGRAFGPAPATALPSPGTAPTDEWSDVVWSDMCGAPGPGDPKGFLPEEFLRLGTARAGEAVHVRFVLDAGPDRSHLLLGSSATARAWWNGTEVDLEAGAYYARGIVRPTGGDDVLEVRLTAVEDGEVLGSWSLTAAPRLDLPEWVTGSDVLERRGCPGGRVQLGTIGRVSLEVDGVEVARHGECDNYTHVAQPRVRRYDLPAGDVLRLRLHEPRAAAVLDGSVVTDSSWRGVSGGVTAPHDPRWAHLHSREHPLDDRATVVAGADADEVFRFRLPPGAQGLEGLPQGALVEVGGNVVTPAQAGHRFAPVAAGTWCVVTLPPERDRAGGARWFGPVRARCGASGPMPLGDWQALGLQDFSGGVRYSTTARSEADLLDLGHVRGTVDLYVDGDLVGSRLWAPYTFDVRGRVRAGSQLEVDVFNTLAPHQRAVSSTPWVLPGQDSSGLFGPVALRRAHPGGDA